MKSEKKPKPHAKSVVKTAVKSKKAVQHVKPAKPAKAVKPVKSAKPAKTKPVKAVKPAKAVKAGKKSKPVKTKFKDLRYKLSQRVVYPLQGVGQVTSIKEMSFQGKKTLYYIIYLDVPDMTVMVPTDKVDDRGIRPIVDKREANRALNMVSENHEPVTADWKLRYQMNLDLLKKGNITDIAKVVRSLYNRSRIKELPILERKLYDSARKLLIDEIAYALDKEKNEVEGLIDKKMAAAIKLV